MLNNIKNEEKPSEEIDEKFESKDFDINFLKIENSGENMVYSPLSI